MRVSLKLAVILCLATSWHAAGAPPLLLDAVRFNDLAAELGVGLASGSQVRVALVEASADFDVNAQGYPRDGTYDYLPDSGHPLLADPSRTYFVRSVRGEISAHATHTAARFFGTESLAPGVQEVEVFLADGWLMGDHLQAGSSLAPHVGTARVYNHSWAARGDASLLARVDYAVARHGSIHVVGMNNAGRSGPMSVPSGAFNLITVGRSDGKHQQGSLALGTAPGLEIYNSTRPRPHLVVPVEFTSYAASYVSGAATLLVDAALAHPSWSTGEIIPPGNTSLTTPHAATPTVIKAALMAGANRGFWDDYGLTNQTDNGLDVRYGAGQLDVWESYHILAGGEQERGNSVLGGEIGRYGFDYVPAFDPMDVASYRFSTGATHESLVASLAWNLDLELDFSAPQLRYVVTLADLDLALYEVTSQGNLLIAQSQSRWENTENLWVSALKPDTKYLLHVVRRDDAGPVDFGLAWRRTGLDREVHAPEPSGLILLVTAALAVVPPRRMLRHRSRARP